MEERGDLMHAFEVTTTLSLAEAEAQIRRRLAERGFGVLSEIDVAGTLRAKLGVERPALKILGACNPSLAHRALEVDPTLALLLPCNVVLETTASGKTHIAIADPRDLLAVGDGGLPELDAVVQQASAELAAVVSGFGE